MTVILYSVATFRDAERTSGCVTESGCCLSRCNGQHCDQCATCIRSWAQCLRNSRLSPCETGGRKPPSPQQGNIVSDPARPEGEWHEGRRHEAGTKGRTKEKGRRAEGEEKRLREEWAREKWRKKERTGEEECVEDKRRKQERFREEERVHEKWREEERSRE